ncbi:hydantoinase/carbamoylase family amidase [Aquibium sp. A9E412]|uniref:hydantoinase/carbamoylase family amidase n=1 Tax=Aquibium sp. A9E412 TaxID=2976767 RepID=UPI0025AF1FAD|nr:hydantoinase/carbamoylase family amidase [Aquibium sp. A9E412]MDN2565529.1 hydantoinase/carbamoylase family amidase [Aquibium sp. A9E412]
MAAIAISPERLLADLDTLRGIGRRGTGVVRPAFSPADLEARGWLAGRMREAGLAVAVDRMGNLFGLPPGDAPCLLVGSHSDSQPEGGWLDGAYGVIAGLEIARASLEGGGPPVAVVSFQDEEGRFCPLAGSRVWSGRMPLAEAEALVDLDGVRLADLDRLPPGIDAPAAVPHGRFRAFLEMHIEQGPVLDRSGERIGVVENIFGICGERLSFTGEQNHAGTTPMALRRDAFQGLARFATLLDARFTALAVPSTVWTIGHVAVHPNAVSIVPGRVDFSVQWRDADAARLAAMTQAMRETADAVAAERDLTLERSGFVTIPPSRCEPSLVAALADAAEALAPGAWRRMPSGALHDAANVSTLMPMAMLFVPSIGGISHSFDEDTDRADLVLGARVLARAVAAI